MSLPLRKVPNASGATAVQIVTKRHGKLTVVDHIGRAHTSTQLAAVVEAIAHEKINETTGQLALDLDTNENVSATSRRRGTGFLNQNWVPSTTESSYSLESTSANNMPKASESFTALIVR